MPRTKLGMKVGGSAESNRYRKLSDRTLAGAKDQAKLESRDPLAGSAGAAARRGQRRLPKITVAAPPKVRRTRS